MTVTYTTDGGLVGVSFLSAAEGGSGGLDGGFGGGGGLPSFGRTLLAELTSSLILDEGTGGPTWSRATKAWGFNELGYLEELVSGCAFFGGARLVYNTLTSATSYSENVSVAGWSKSNCTTPSADTVVCAASNSHQRITGGSITTVAGQVFYCSFRATYVDAQFIQARLNWSFTPAYVNFDLLNGTYAGYDGFLAAGMTLVSPGVYDCWCRLATTYTGSGATAIQIQFVTASNSIPGSNFNGDGIKSFKITRLSVVDVTNYDASYIPEYVSVGVEASPYFGAGIDGAKYFETDWQGAPIAAANLLGFRREVAATNNLLHSRDLSNAAWSTKTNVTAAKTSTGLDGIANTATTLTATAADSIILQPITLASAARCASAYVKRRTGTGTISFTQDGGSTWTGITAQINSSTWSRVQITSTLANPSVGFKISTSGDAIDVDCVQNEAGAVATSPIVTTTAAVTRNEDSLQYQRASNLDFAVGTSFSEVMSLTGAGNRMAIDVGGNGYSATNATVHDIWRIYDGVNVVTKTGLSSIATGMRKRVVSWGPAGTKVTGDGLAPDTGAFDGAFGLGATIILAYNFNGYIKNLAIYNYQMTDAELQAITS